MLTVAEMDAVLYVTIYRDTYAHNFRRHVIIFVTIYAHKYIGDRTQIETIPKVTRPAQRVSHPETIYGINIYFIIITLK